MSFWLKVRQAIRAGDELVPPIVKEDPPVIGYDPPGASPIPPKPILEEPVVVPVPEAVIPEDVRPKEAAGEAAVDSRKYVNQIRPLAHLIGRTEGTDKGRGYSETLGYGAYTGGPVDLVLMNLAQIDALQTKMLAHPKNKLNSSAVGRYQYIRTTLRALKKKWGIADTQRFDAAFQDDLLYISLVGRGLVRWRKGELSEDAFINALSAEWASLPNTKGKGTYKGQHTGCTVEELRAVLAQIK